jgi:hypothetical protein
MRGAHHRAGGIGPQVHQFRVDQLLDGPVEVGDRMYGIDDGQRVPPVAQNRDCTGDRRGIRRQPAHRPGRRE